MWLRVRETILHHKSILTQMNQSHLFHNGLFIQNSKDECSVDVYMVDECKFQSR